VAIDENADIKMQNSRKRGVIPLDRKIPLDRRKSYLAGLTIIEMVMVMVVVAALAGGIGWFVVRAVDTWNFLTFRSDEATQGRLALDRMVREIRQIKDKSSVNVATSNNLAFTDIEDASIEYSLSGSNLMRNSDILASGVSNLQFTYYDVNNNQLSSPQVLPDETDIWRIIIDLSIQSGDQSITLRSQVYPRNF
jgi:type II secretory pathway pseudopilin PulG